MTRTAPTPRPAADRPQPVAASTTQTLTALAEQATRRIAPLWPLQHFVAVNPFLGLTDHRFSDAAALLARVAGARMTMPYQFYRDAIASGRIDQVDLDEARRRIDDATTLPPDMVALKRARDTDTSENHEPIPTVTDVASRLTGRDWSAFATDRISAWAASHFDDGQAPWPSPSRHQLPYAAWREHALIDRTPQLMGLPRLREVIRTLPDTAPAMLDEGVARLQLHEDGIALYFHRLLMSIGGWAGYARYLVWQSELRGQDDTTAVELLAVRLAWDVAMLEAHVNHVVIAASWAQTRQRFVHPDRVDSSQALDQLLHCAYEINWQRDFIRRLEKPPAAHGGGRRALQAAFCIDVRSEVFRRALESAAPQVDTLGFAGFFGMPIEVVPLGQTRGGAQCPVLLTPAVTVHENVKRASPSERADILQRRRLRQRAAGGWRWFKMAAVSSFAFVETMGWTYAGKLLANAFGVSRPVADPATAGIDARALPRLAPDIDPSHAHGVVCGITPEIRVQLAEGALKGMSLRQDFARLVMLTGHGATTVNNPHASGLHCGACGGHSGAANARVAAAVLNDPHIRRQLTMRGISIPADTWFLGALHDTTTDAVTVFDQEDVPPTHTEDLARLLPWLAEAGERARLERAGALHLRGSGHIDAKIVARSRDWSQVRPEWGLAGCAAYVVAPRQRTAGVDLGGRAFLNSYDWRQDDDFAVLESIMTAPMVVGSWISLQYYASAVDNRVFGCGNKVLHNVVGTLGVLEGNAGDLRSGLPWQSVHDGMRLVHEPLRLSVVIAAPLEAINRIIGKHQAVRELVDHQWIHLFALPDDAAPMRRYCGALQWEDAA